MEHILDTIRRREAAREYALAVGRVSAAPIACRQYGFTDVIAGISLPRLRQPRFGSVALIAEVKKLHPQQA
jgi:hypothetical protein